MKPDQVLRAQADLLAALGTPTHVAYAGSVVEKFTPPAAQEAP